MKVRVRVIISGVVQGVFFRSNIRSNANLLGIHGWVKNTRNEKVEIVFEGDKELVDKMVEYCHKGPPGAMIDKVDVFQEKYRGDFKEFVIK